MPTKTTTVSDTTPVTPSHSKASNDGLKIAVQTVNLIKKSKPQTPRGTITHVSDDDTIAKYAQALGEYVHGYVSAVKEWQARYNEALAYLASYPSTWNLELPSGNRACGKVLAHFLTHGGLVEDNKFIAKL